MFQLPLSSRAWLVAFASRGGKRTNALKWFLRPTRCQTPATLLPVLFISATEKSRKTCAIAVGGLAAEMQATGSEGMARRVQNLTDWRLSLGCMLCIMQMYSAACSKIAEILHPSFCLQGLRDRVTDGSGLTVKVPSHNPGQEEATVRRPWNA